MPPHASPAPNADGDAHRSAETYAADLQAQITTLRAQITGRDAALTRAAARRDKATAAHEAARADYRATPAGLSASLRHLERALLAGRPAREIRALQHAHIRAEAAANREYRKRAARWGHKPGDGPLLACPIGADGPFATWMLNLAVTGTYRHAPTRADNTVVARLSRPSHGRRKEQARLTVPVELIGREGLTLWSILTDAAAQPDQHVRLRRLLGPHTGPVLAALNADPPTV